LGNLEFPFLVGVKAASLGIVMEPATKTSESLPSKPICIGLTCWRWQRTKPRAIRQLAKRLGVNLQLTEKIRGLHRVIEAQVSGQNTDRFIGEFGRHC
jgi:hypothetical protein